MRANDRNNGNNEDSGTGPGPAPPLLQTGSTMSTQQEGPDRFDEVLYNIDPDAAMRAGSMSWHESQDGQVYAEESSYMRGLREPLPPSPVKTKSVFKKDEEAFYNADTNDDGTDDIWGLLSSAGGNIYEWYDFAVYGLMSNEIGHNFFPEGEGDESDREQLVAAFEVYFVAFLMRPIGAVIFGEIGDRWIGRKNALTLCIVLITIPSIMMGFVPGYATIGEWAPTILILLRIMQGLSVGGQLAGSYVLSIEASTPNNRGIRGAICDVSSVAGFLAASAVCSIARTCFRQEVMDDWGWRVPFWVSAVLAPILFKVVHSTEDTGKWEQSAAVKETEDIIRESENKSATPAFIDLLRSPFRVRQLTGMVCLLSSMLAAFKMLFLWVPIYLSSLRGLTTETTAGYINIIVIIFYMFVLIAGGKISDQFEHRMDLIRIAIPGVIVSAPVMYAMFECDSLLGITLAQCQMAFCLALLQGGMAAYEVELWMADPSLSFTGVAIGHNLGSCFFGGTLPLIATSLYYRGADMIDNAEGMAGEDLLLPRILPGLYISCLGVLGLWAINFIIRHPHDIKTGEKIIRQKRKEKMRHLKRLAINFSHSFLEGDKPEGYTPPKDSRVIA
jgi:MHS family proline/betaine transporter-like MFS transporter